MNRHLRTILQYLFFIGLGLFFVWLSVKNIHQTQWIQIKDAVARARHWLILPALGALLLAHYSRALRWKILMEPMGYSPSNFNVFAAVMIGYLVNAGVPRLGEVVKCSMLARYERVRVDRLVGTIVMERAVDVVCLVIAFIAALILEGNVIMEPIRARFGSFFSDPSGHTSIIKILVWIGIIALIIMVVSFLLKRFGHIDAVGKIRNAITGIRHGLQSIRMVKHKGMFLFHTALIWACYLAGSTIGIYALRETAHLGIGGGLTTLVLGSIGMLVSPGGIGAYAWIVSKLMGWYGLPEDTIGTALGWLLWSVQTLIILVGGLICLGLFSYFNKKLARESIQSDPEQNINV